MATHKYVATANGQGDTLPIEAGFSIAALQRSQLYISVRLAAPTRNDTMEHRVQPSYTLASLPIAMRPWSFRTGGAKTATSNGSHLTGKMCASVAD